ncbi:MULTISPECIES: universal stress protein [unclassified Streptomyces]|uniref:universal stress protein n=1 Tax=unclassified Streptomyces TaxID=2593676 RepID=UPI003D7241EE
MNGQYVVVGVDGSPVADRALDWAADDAVRRGAELRVVYAVPDLDEAAPVLAAAVRRAGERHPDLVVRREAAQGGAVPALARAARGAALTVVGTRGYGNVGSLLARSVSVRLAARVPGPLLVVRGDHPCDDGRAVVVGLASDDDTRAAAFAFREASRRGVALRVLHAHGHRHSRPELPSLVPATSPGQRAEARLDLAEEAVPRFGVAELRELHPRVGVDARTVRTAPARALLDATRDAGVVVIGHHRRSGPLGPHLGAVAHALLLRSHCPVVLVPTAPHD